jgi:hypothetical protein
MPDKHNITLAYTGAGGTKEDLESSTAIAARTWAAMATG